MNIFTNKLYILTEQNDIYRDLIESLALPNLHLTTNKQEADVVLAAPPLLASQLDEFENLKWVQSVYAGVDSLMHHRMRQDYLLTNVKGIFGQQIAEYVLGYTIEHYRHFLTYRTQQQAQRWVPYQYQTLSNKTMSIVGTGTIGTHLAKVSKAFGIRTIGVNTRGIPTKDSPFDEIYHIDELNNAIEKSDIVVSTLPSTPNTIGVFNQQVLSSGQGILIFNVGRGSSINQDDLLEALDKGYIEQAFLDVFEQEPLNIEHPYWKHPKITLTPHIAALSFPEQVVEVFANYYKNWEKGFTIRDCINFDKGY
ncbi:D-2-hydroxyacid dehydrogenase [Vibrio kasasachensis]|uniref:D-2-hydroxyacid dehydrogenase n=1 Tax=Vibrio kasasachensis TaxID=2910248 RepID=UPI003D103D3A